MERRFIVIFCEQLKDPYECDADRRIAPMLYSQSEVKKLQKSLIEVYEIVNTRIKPRPDLSTY